MSPRQSDSRQRLVGAAAQMLAQHGFNATSIRETAKRAGAPVGSTYHHFPGGKHQMVIEAVQLAGATIDTQLQKHLQAGAAAGLDGFLAAWREILARSDFSIGCPVIAAAIEEPIDQTAVDVLRAAADVFGTWEKQLTQALVAAGHAPSPASDIATLIVTSVEGAIALCRARRSIDPLDKVARQLRLLIAVPEGASARPVGT